MNLIKIVEQKPLRIIFCLPGPSFSHNFLMSWTELLREVFVKGHTPYISCQQDSVVYYVRNKCLGGDVLRGKDQKPFNGQIAYDYMMWLDSDMVFQAKDFFKLLSWNKNIVSGMYKSKGGQVFTTVEKWDEEYFKKTGSFQFMTDKDIKGKKDLIDVAYTGFGFILFKYGVFEALEYPWFQPIFHTIGNARDFSSEDVSICRLLKEKNYKIYVDPTVRVGHEKTCVY